jgi:hypothetical protein
MSVAILIGPEGGTHPEEEEQFAEGLRSVRTAHQHREATVGRCVGDKNSALYHISSTDRTTSSSSNSSNEHFFLNIAQIA